MGFTTTSVKRLWGSSYTIYRQGNFFTNGAVGLAVPEESLPLVEGMILRAGKETKVEEDIDVKAFPAGYPVDRSELARHFKLGATDPKGTRLVLKHVYIDKEHMVSADGYWLAVSHVSSPVSVLAAPMVADFLKFAEGDLTVATISDAGKVHYQWCAGGWSLVYSEDEMSFPDYSQIYPQVPTFSLWDKSKISLAHTLPKLDVFTGILRLGGFWPFHQGVALAPKFAKFATDFVGEDELQVGGAVVEPLSFESEQYEQWSCYGQYPVWFKGSHREVLAMPMLVNKGMPAVPDPLVPDLLWKK